MALPNDYEAQADNAEHLRDTLESAWDEGEAVADEKQVARDVWSSEIERRDATDREIAEAAYDASVARREARQGEAEPARRIEDYPDPADRHEIRKELNEGWDAAAKADTGQNRPLTPDETAPDRQTPKDRAASPAENAPDGANAGGQNRPDAPAWSTEDRAVLDKMTPEARQWTEAKAAAVRQSYGGVDALAAKHGGYLSQLGATTPEAQVGVLDTLLATERALRTGTPEQKVAIVRNLVREYGVGGPAQAQPPAPAAPHPLQQAALAAPQAAPTQPPPANPNDLRGRLESDWQAQRAAEAARQTPEAQAQAQRQEYDRVVGEIQTFAAAKDETGHPQAALFNAVVPEMTEAARMLLQAGHKPDLPTVYKAAVQYAAKTRPEIAQLAMADARGQVAAFKRANPVAADPNLVERMTSVAKADQRITGKVDFKSVMDRALKLEPEVAAQQAAHAAREKELGFDKPRPSLRQLLETGWSAQAA